MNNRKIYPAKNIFTGEEWLSNQVIVVKNNIIEAIIPSGETDPSAESYDTIIPSLIDLQIYGAYSKLFSVYPEPETLSLTHKYCSEGGAFYFQPTVATNTKEVIHNCIDAVRQYWDGGGKGCLGLHVEGPWINKEKRGAHIDSLIHAPSLKEVEELLDYGRDVIKMITLAPEICTEAVIKKIIDSGVIVSAGHSNCSFSEANKSFEKGITAVTHLYNAMSSLHHREPGLVGAALLNKRIMASIVADGYHVDFAAIKIAQQLMKERLFLITDAVTETDQGAYPHQKEGDKYIASGILSGSALTMLQAVKNMIEKAGADKTEAIKMACTYPAKAIGMQNRIGKISEGFEARLFATDKDLNFVHLI